MTMNKYMTFDEAAAFLHTPRSTLYRWLAEGRVPGHKLGRQWRFLRSELDQFIRSGDSDAREIDDLAAVLKGRLNEEDAMNVDLQTPKLVAERLIWDAANEGAWVVHLGPKDDGYDIRYRSKAGLTTLHPISSGAFDALDQHLVSVSQPLRRQEKRRFYLERAGKDGTERLQVRYQKLETFSGDRLTLRLVPEGRFPQEIDLITAEAEEAQRLRRWSKAKHGLILVAGRSGSGKTTTAYCLLNEIAKAKDKVIFTMEDTVEIFLANVNQVSVDLDDETAYRQALGDILDSDLDVLFIASNFAQRHLTTLWGSALSTAEAGHVVLVQLEANSADDALAKFCAATDRPIDDHLVGVVWQELITDEATGTRSAQYQFIDGPLDIGTAQ